MGKYIVDDISNSWNSTENGTEEQWVSIGSPNGLDRPNKSLPWPGITELFDV